jgi:hypothetical protein
VRFGTPEENKCEEGRVRGGRTSYGGASRLERVEEENGKDGAGGEEEKEKR